MSKKAKAHRMDVGQSTYVGQVGAPRSVSKETTDPLPDRSTRLGDLYGESSYGGTGYGGNSYGGNSYGEPSYAKAYAKPYVSKDDDDRDSDHTGHGDHRGRDDHRGDDHRHHEDSDDEESVVTSSDPFVDSRLIWTFGIVLALVTALYFYWLSLECCVAENEEANLTMQYAIDKSEKHRKDREAEEKQAAVTLTITEAGPVE